jgi:hypothetical protein
MNRGSWTSLLGLLLACAPVAGSEDKAVTPDVARVNDGKAWNLLNAEATAAAEGDKTVVRLKPKGEPGPGSLVGLAVVNGLEFAEGVIEVDVKGNGKTRASFPGIAFGVADVGTFEAVCFRPFNFQRPDPTFRARAVQYVSWPDHPWEKLRRDKPGGYEAAVRPVPDPAGWFHVKVVVTKQKVSVFVNGATEPCLAVDRLPGAGKGQVGLWVDSQESAFANLRIVPTRTP